MSQQARVIEEPQRMKALEQANRVRLARAELKRRIAYGETSAADVILACPPEAGTWSVGELLMSQRRWGDSRCRKFLVRNQINELKPLGTLTERQRKLLAAQLRACMPPALVPRVDKQAPVKREPVAPAHTRELLEPVAPALAFALAVA